MFTLIIILSLVGFVIGILQIAAGSMSDATSVSDNGIIIAFICAVIVMAAYVLRCRYIL